MTNMTNKEITQEEKKPYILLVDMYSENWVIKGTYKTLKEAIEDAPRVTHASNYMIVKEVEYEVVETDELSSSKGE